MLHKWKTAGTGVVAAPKIDGLSLAGVPATVVIDISSAEGISYVQDKLYEKLDIKK